MDSQSFRYRFVKAIYGDQNNSNAVKRQLINLFNNFDSVTQKALNVGAGSTRVHPDIINLDLEEGLNTDVIGSIEKIPFPNNHFDIIVSQEVLEHVRDYSLAVIEMKRVLKPGGKIYCQLPFIIGYHPGPHDFWRFSKEGIEQIFTQHGFEIENTGIAVGPATGFYRILVEFSAILMSKLFRGYHLFKGFFALLYFPIKFLDIVLNNSKEADRIAGGYFIVLEKPKNTLDKK